MAQTFRPGFRCSWLDAAVLVVGFAAAGVVERWIPWGGVTIGFVVAHFFLFCNVFRIRRGAELVWAAAFIGLGAATIWTDRPGWPAVYAGAAVLTALLLAVELRAASYHGIGWRIVNPQLEAWWRGDQCWTESSTASAPSAASSTGIRHRC